ncbi:hypothetical protein DL93DRAFT_2168552 [Clavulina sp. PMI_390]|nr:hypothetical protein DL93DRAFT_2168552 [Clavulina sp. PMI_390]
MVQIRAFIALTTGALCGVMPAFAVPLEARVDTRHGSDYCAGTWNNGSEYYCGDVRLGPAKLPTAPPLSGIVGDYDRLGGLKPADFLDAWWNTTGVRWYYPSENGFQLDISRKPILGNQSLPIGLLLDRFGAESGKFLAPADTPYRQRSLHPQSLNAPINATDPYNYHVYKVTKPFVVSSGVIAPWFGQPGQGVQYAANMNVSSLTLAGYIKRINLTDATSVAILERDLESQRLRRRGSV